MRTTIGNFDLEVSLRALKPWRHFKIHRTDTARHLVWGKLSIHIEDWTMEVHKVCAECGSRDVGERGYGDEYLTVCSSCRSVEQGYKYVNLREYENAP